LLLSCFLDDVVSSASTVLQYAPSRAAGPLFDVAELKRVGVAVTMIAVLGTIVILAILVAMMFVYSSLAHCGPKAVVDGAVIALLMGQKTRWRCLVLAATVYGFVLMLQLGIVYLVPVMMIAGIIAAIAGRTIGLINRTWAVAIAAVVYELLSSFGAPIKILLATDGKEPVLWGMWLAEWPLRIVGAIIGVLWALKWQRNRRARKAQLDAQIADHDSPPMGDLSPAHTDTAVDMTSANLTPTSNNFTSKSAKSHRLAAWRTTGAGSAGICLTASILSCVLPMVIESWLWLGAIVALYLAYALWTGMRKRLFHAVMGLLYGWVIFTAASYVWHHDPHRVVDLLRTLVLRFAPLTIAAAVLVTSVRPVDVLRLLRRCRLPRVIILPLAHVARSLPQIRQEFRTAIGHLRRQGTWTGPLSVIRSPRAITIGLLGPSFQRWADELAE
jgi:hypothetical protein